MMLDGSDGFLGGFRGQKNVKSKWQSQQCHAVGNGLNW